MYNINYFESQDDAVNSTPNFPCVVKLATSDKIGIFNGDNSKYTIFVKKGDFITPQIETKLVCVYDITDVTAPTDILYSIDKNFIGMEVDGVEVTLSETYSFTEQGKHVIKFTLEDKTTLTANSTPSGIFYKCTTLTSVIIPYGITKLIDRSFFECTNLYSVNIPKSVTHIASRSTFYDTPWYNVYKTDTTHIVDNVIYINNIAYDITSQYITTASIKDGTIHACQSLFDYCRKLTAVTLPNSLINIPAGMFSWCDRLKSINIPNNCVSIGDSAFYKCSGLSELTIPVSVKFIGDAFEGCYNLKSLTYNGTIAQWKEIECKANWSNDTKITYVNCTDGTYKLA